VTDKTTVSFYLFFLVREEEVKQTNDVKQSFVVGKNNVIIIGHPIV